MTIDTSLLARGLVTNEQFNELIEDYDENIIAVSQTLDALTQRVSVLEHMLNGLIEGNE